MKTVFEMFVAFAAAFAFAVIFNVNAGELIFCGISGLTAQGVCSLSRIFGAGDVFSVLLASLCAAAAARSFANIRRMPVTAYLLCGIIPLVPGAGMYKTVYSIIASDYTLALLTGVNTIKTASAVAVGIFLIFALPNKIFFKK